MRKIIAIIAVLFMLMLCIMPIYADETETTTATTVTATETAQATTETTAETTTETATTPETTTETETTALTTESTAATTETTVSTTESTAATTETTVSTTESTAATTETTVSTTESTAATTETTVSTTESTAATTESTASTAETTAETTTGTATMPETTAETTSITWDTGGAGGDNIKNNTLFSRLWEFVKQYSTEVVTAIGSAALFVLNFLLKNSNKKSADATKRSLSDISNVVSGTSNGQAAVIGVINNLVDGYNELKSNYDKMKESYDTYGAAESERNRVVGAVFATNTAILEILTTVYANNRNLPQGVKDLVNLQYANCLKTLENDEQLKAIADSVRENIGGYAKLDTEAGEKQI